MMLVSRRRLGVAPDMKMGRCCCIAAATLAVNYTRIVATKASTHHRLTLSARKGQGLMHWLHSKMRMPGGQANMKLGHVEGKDEGNEG